MKNKIPELVATVRHPHSRREFIRRVAYASPAVLTLPAAPSFAQQGSAAGGGDPGNGDPGGTDPDLGPRPGSEIDCTMPLTPIDSNVASNMCTFSLDTDSNEFLFEDIIVNQDAIPGRLAQGDLLGTCDSFYCNAS